MASFTPFLNHLSSLSRMWSKEFLKEGLLSFRCRWTAEFCPEELFSCVALVQRLFSLPYIYRSVHSLLHCAVCTTLLSLCLDVECTGMMCLESFTDISATYEMTVLLLYTTIAGSPLKLVLVMEVDSVV